MKNRYVICSMATMGSETPYEARSSQILSIWFFNVPVIITSSFLLTLKFISRILRNRIPVECGGQDSRTVHKMPRRRRTVCSNSERQEYCLVVSEGRSRSMDRTSHLCYASCHSMGKYPVFAEKEPLVSGTFFVPDSPLHSAPDLSLPCQRIQ